MPSASPTALEDLLKFLKPVFGPLLAVVLSFAQQENAAHTARHAVVQTSQRRINQLSKRWP
jgi:hypothetical protein